MIETLVITYLPSGRSSRTKRLLDCLLNELADNYYVIDLLSNEPPFLTPDRIQAFVKRNYQGVPLNLKEGELVSRSDEYIKNLHEANNLVLAYPMHNFSMPAIVKAFFDAVIVKGETFDIKNSKYVGLMNGKRGLALTTSGGCYDDESGWSDYEHCFSLQENLFEFLGYHDNEVISVQGCDQLPPNDVEQRFNEAFDRLLKYVRSWGSKVA